MPESHLTICVAALTYKRPETLARLLDAFARLQQPNDCTVHFLIVDNDPEGSGRPAVEAAGTHGSHTAIRYVIEGKPGIPAARNRALDEARSGGADLLCFTDDDAWPDSGWLVSLVNCYRQTGAALIFGPQRLVRPVQLKSIRKRFIARSLEARSRFVERFSERQARRGRIATSGTYNWMGDLSWLVRNGIRFDEARQFSGGTDTAFRESVSSRNGTLSWCPKAVIYEEIPEERLSIRYQWKRSRNQGMNAATFKRPVHPAILRHPLGRVLVGVALIVLPVFGLASFSLGLHQLGMGIGALQGRASARDDLYRR